MSVYEPTCPHCGTSNNRDNDRCWSCRKSLTDKPNADRLRIRQLERELVDARNVQHHIVTMPGGSAVAAPCAISGCQYARPPESATPAAVVIVDAAGNSSVVLDSQFRAALTTGEHVLFARAYMNDSPK